MARPRAQDYDEKREAILARAAELFARQGYERTSMAEVAAACGTSKALLYHYYDSKDVLLNDIISGHLDRLRQAVKGASNGETKPRKQLRAVVGALLEAYGKAQDEHRVHINDLAALPTEKQAPLKAAEKDVVSALSASLRAAVPGVEPKLVRALTMSLLGMLNTHQSWARAPGSPSRDAYADLVTRLVTDGAKRLGD
jgi:TetR/AcrR family transcriptional regulator